MLRGSRISSKSQAQVCVGLENESAEGNFLSQKNPWKSADQLILQAGEVFLMKDGVIFSGINREGAVWHQCRVDPADHLSRTKLYTHL